jgi:AhpD family alkylhydroperoxidase
MTRPQRSLLRNLKKQYGAPCLLSDGRRPVWQRRKEEAHMKDPMFPANTREFAHRRRELQPEAEAAFRTFGKVVFEDRALSAKTKQIIAVAVAHVTQCPYCIKGHTRAAMHHGASEKELIEAIWVAAEMRAGAAYAHSVLALEEMGKTDFATDGAGDGSIRKLPPKP